MCNESMGQCMNAYHMDINHRVETVCAPCMRKCTSGCDQGLTGRQALKQTGCSLPFGMYGGGGGASGALVTSNGPEWSNIYRQPRLGDASPTDRARDLSTTWSPERQRLEAEIVKIQREATQEALRVCPALLPDSADYAAPSVLRRVAGE